MRKENSVLRTRFISEAGSQLVNADYFAFVELDNYACYCIADGIDNDRMKESAKLAVTAVIDEFYQRPGNSRSLLKHYLDTAHRTLLKESGTVRLEASVLVVITDYKKVRYANAGNARMYYWRNGKIINQSKDQSLSQDLAEHGELAMDKIEIHEERHNLFCYAGQRGTFRPYVSKKFKMMDGDIISLMTCGIWETTGIAELLDSIEDAKAPEEVCAGIEDIILSQRLRNIQNYTFSCIYIDKVYRNPNRQRHMKIVKRIAIPLCIILLILGIVFTVKTVVLYKNINSMWTCIDLAVEDMAAGSDESGNKNYEKANKFYDGFDSRSELSKDKVIEARAFMKLFEYREEYVKGETCYDRYVAACKLLTCLVGSNGFVRLDDDNVDDKTLSLSSLKKVSTKYLDKAAKADLEYFKKGLLQDFENLKAEYQVYLLLEQAKKLFDTEINNSLIEDAKKYGIATYNFNNTKFSVAYDLLKNTVSTALSSNIKLTKTNDDYIDFLSKVSSKLEYIKGSAYLSQGDALADNKQYTDAKSAYCNAKDAMKRAGEDTYAGDIATIENKLAGVNQEISDKTMDSAIEEARTLWAQACDEFLGENYAEADETCIKALDKLSQAGVSTGTVYNDLENLKNKIDIVNKALDCEKEGKKMYEQHDYNVALQFYVEAKNKYNAAGASTKEKAMIYMIADINTKIQPETTPTETK